MNRREWMKGVVAGVVAYAARPACARIQVDPTLTETTFGPVTGMFSPNRVLSFKSVPYGRSTAVTRFAAPQPPSPWAAPLSCGTWTTRAPQTIGARPENTSAESRAAADARPGYHLTPDEGTDSEDCLHLNVWTPDIDRKQRPVMVYIHGGAYANGTVNAPVYDGARLAKRGDVVVVTVNHRLNSFGYMYLAELLPGQGFEDSGNAGQLDLVLALEWVRDNIRNFGGDPSRVMIFGQSGGGAKCATLMAMPAAKGLFHRVLTMSGQQVTGVEPKVATERARLVLKALGIDPSNPAEAAKALRAASMLDIQKATRAAGYFGPVRDGRALPVDPFSPTAPAISSGIPMVLGNTHDETRGLIGGGRPDLFSLTWETLPAALERDAPFLRSATVSLPVAEVIAKYREWHPQYSASDVFFAVTTDSRSWRGQVIEADVRAADAKAAPHTWVYELDFKSGVDGDKWGAPHTLDIPLAFDNVAVSGHAVGMSTDDQARAQRMADIVSDFYIAFARTGSPQTKALPTWKPYSLAHRETMLLDLPCRLANDPRGREREYLGQVPYVQPGTV